MSRRDGDGVCEHCQRTFSYYLIHNGFNESAYGYCDRCGLTAILDGWRMPGDMKTPVHRAIPVGLETRLTKCACGGTFSGQGSPRCPHCAEALSADFAAAYIEANAPGFKGGWRWQRNWFGLYCIVIENRVVHDPWPQTQSGIYDP